MSRCADVSRLALSVVLSACMVASSVPVPALAEAAEIASGGGGSRVADPEPLAAEVDRPEKTNARATESANATTTPATIPVS